MSDDNESKAPTDLLVPLTHANEAGEHVVLRSDPEGNLRIGVLGPVRDGQTYSNDAELVTLQHLEGEVYQVSASTGPALVNSQAYRNNWEGIFGNRSPVGSA